VEDAVAACDGRRQAAVVEQVCLEQPQPLRGAVQPQQVRVLGVAGIASCRCRISARGGGSYGRRLAIRREKILIYYTRDFPN
jgi:hypothetical protein